MSRKLLFVITFFWLAGSAMQVGAEEIRVRDLPIPDGATDVSTMKRRGDVRFQVPSDFKAVGNFYAKVLAEQKWTKSGKDNLQRNFWVQKFAKDNRSLEVRVDSRNGGSEVRLTPKGLMWDEDDQPSPKELPLPKDATEVKYDDFFESIEFKSPSSIKELAESMTQQLLERKWTKETTEFDLETFVRMKFSQGKSTLTIDLRSEESVCEVSIKTEGMQWNGMKELIERSKKKSEKTVDVAPQKKELAVKPLELPSRKEKPKQGIGNLPELPNEATVIMDGETYKLSSVFAYEIFEDGEWATKVVATQKPVKQQSLLTNLKLTGTDKNSYNSSPTWPQPFLEITLDENDRPSRLSLQAGKTPGSGLSSALTGSALVEDGRARGTVQLKEPGSFFDKVYTAEISFDVPVLTRESTPAKRLVDATKLANSGTLTIGDKKYELSNCVAFEMKRFDEPMTTVLLSEKPLNLSNLKAALGKKSADDYFEFIPQVKLLIDAEDNLSSMQIWADNTSIGGNDDIVGDIVIEDGRARGTATMAKPGEFFERKYTFELSFDTEVLGTPTSASPQPRNPTGGLVADSHNGLPFPEGGEGFESEGSKFRKQTSKTVLAEMNAVIEFYRRELASTNWTENTDATKINNTSATLPFTGPDGTLLVQLKSDGDNTAISLISRDAKGAKAAGVLPAPGKGRLLVGNASEKIASVTINKSAYSVAAGAGAEDPKGGLNFEIAPGKYIVEVKLPDKTSQTETLMIGADETWGVIVFPDGDCFPIQLY